MSDVPDPLWSELRYEVAQIAKREPLLASYLHATVLKHRTLESALSFLLSGKLESPYLTALSLHDILRRAFRASPEIRGAIRADLAAVVDRDPAAGSPAVPFLYFKGFHALEAYRVSNWLWAKGRKHLALYLQTRISEVFGLDIHPAARIGQGILIDHGTGVVIGETAVVGDNVSMLHEVTLGGTGKQVGDRHPKIGAGVLLGAGAKVLGNISVGAGSKVAAGSVVLNDVEAHTTVAGIPARVVGMPSTSEPSRSMDHGLEVDYVI
jgi:serine O-acetyltransferase